MDKLINLSIRLPKELHTFLRKNAFDQNTSINSVILKCLQKFKKKEEKKLTQDETIVL